MTDLNINSLLGLSLSAQELGQLTRWAPILVEDYLAKTRNLLLIGQETIKQIDTTKKDRAKLFFYAGF